MARTGLSIGIKTDYKAALKNLQRIQRFDIPAAKASALARAGDSALTEVSTKIAAGADVPKWMVRGVSAGSGTKAGGARVSRTKYIRKIDGIIVYLRHTHINPTGTARKKNPVVQLKRGGVRVSGARRTYRDGFYRPSNYGGAIYTRKPGGGLKMETIPLDPWAEQVLRNTCRRVVPREFKKRFEHEMARRLAKRRRSG
jgi:hypothetical protein